MPRRTPLAAAAAALPLLLLTASCASSSPTSRPTGPSAAGSSAAASSARHVTDWPTYHRTDNRHGRAAHGPALPLHTGWSRHLRGAVYGEPVVANGVMIAATERDWVYGLDPRTGHRLWRKHLGTAQPQSGLPCGDIDPLGITGTPAYDAATRSVFVVAETTGGHHTLWALNAATGHRRWHRGLDVLPKRNRFAEQQRSALLVSHGRVLTAFGGLAGDCDNYVGYMTSVATTGHGRTFHYAVPTTREGGMWSPAGPMVGQNGRIYVASGNGAETGGRWDKSDSVTELTPKRLHRTAVFAPSTWRDDNAQDLDLGSSSPVPVRGRLVIAGKRGTVYLLRKGLGGVGGDIAQASGCPAYGGAAVSGHTVVLPCHGGIRAVHVGRHSLRWLWTATNLYGSPVIAGSRVYLADRDTGKLDVLSLGSGRVTQSLDVGSLTHFPSEVVDGARVYVPTLSGITSFVGS